ncbi:MAG TPA: NYN domain-containing protein, partial [Longimicrobiales bacterium]|nr:NYN domain-containing protein [Longimicrobiales bacterium]
MTAQFARALTRGRPGSGATTHEPHAALLIDFDNVTMGIRSDLTKELKNLLNSDIIKGKVAVQRAYADWRRYPQYIVPLAESSVDLIFAPAYGSAKKNATDIRLAIDAVELVFTRPEIGTIILLSGDSDFSSLVLKLKEYGKYVIGVGIRESASDLLVQNCDEYYSYSVLTGLTRAGDEGSPVVSEDPWELVEMSLRQMMENNDVMRSDRLKQVLLEMDPSFDEKTLGFQKFNKFLVEAASRGIISLRKQENGQYEVGPPSAEAVETAAQDARGESREGRARRGRRGRGRREERGDREARDDSQTRPESAPEGIAVQPPAARPAEPAAESAADAERAADAVAARPPADAEHAADTTESVGLPARTDGPHREDHAARGDGVAPADLAAAYALLRKATADLVKKSGSSARDSDVKRRMLELQTGWDEATLGFSKFSRFLRQAHEAGVITLRRGENGNYDVVPGNGDGPQAADDHESRPARKDRGRGRDRDAGRRGEVAPAVAGSKS